MKKSIYSESEVVKAERTGMSRIRRRSARGYGVTRASLYNWKSKYRGMDVS